MARNPSFLVIAAGICICTVCFSGPGEAGQASDTQNCTEAELVWQNIYSIENDNYGNGITADASGNIYVTGGTGSFNDIRTDCLTIKYNPKGETVWLKVFDGGSKDYGNAVAADLSGNVYLTGYSGNDCFVMKYSQKGEMAWQKTYGFENKSYGTGIALDPAGNIYVSGAFYNGSNYGCFTLKCDPKGSVIWKKTYDNENDDFGLKKGAWS